MACEPYVKTDWVNGTAPAINADNLNNIERGIEDVTVCAIDNAANIEILLGKDDFIAGMIMMWNGSTVPIGWSLCDGSNGTPNLVGVFIRGAATSGATGGSADAVVVSHGHTASAVAAGDHTHSYAQRNKGPAEGGTNTNNGTGSTSSQTTGGAGGHGHTITVNAAGVSGVGANIPPFYELVYIMKV
jgi:hypothetical protein